MARASRNRTFDVRQHLALPVALPPNARPIRARDGHPSKGALLALCHVKAAVIICNKQPLVVVDEGIGRLSPQLRPPVGEDYPDVTDHRLGATVKVRGMNE